MNRKEAEDLLFNAAAIKAVAFGFRLGDGADTYMRTHARNVAAKIFEPGRVEAECEDDMGRAVRSFRLVVDTMISIRGEADRNNMDCLQGNVLGELTLSMAFAKLCPGLWPFC